MATYCTMNLKTLRKILQLVLLKTELRQQQFTNDAKPANADLLSSISPTITVFLLSLDFRFQVFGYSS